MMFTPVSVRISKKAKASDAIPKTPNCEGVKTLASTAILKNDKALVTTLKIDIQEMPFIAIFV